MKRHAEDVEPTFPEVLVDLILAIRRYADEVVAVEGAERLDPHLGIDAAGSVTDLDAVYDPVGTPAVAGDGGDYRFTARETDEGLLVVGDLRGMPADRRETEVDLLDDALVLTIDGRIVWRVPVDGGWTTISDVSVNNEVLEVRVRIRE